MITKPADEKYCGVREEIIKSANPKINIDVLKIHHLYLTERHEIYKKKEILKLPQEQWTNDPIFKQYRFTNIRRELDRESKWLIENISENNKFSLSEKILWSLLFRTWNKSETFRKLNLIDIINIENITNSTLEELRMVINQLITDDPKYVWYTAAFNCGGLKASWALPEQRLYECTNSNTELNVIHRETKEFYKKMPWKEAKSFSRGSEYTIEGLEECMPLRMLHLIKWVSEQDIVERILESKNQQECYNIIMEVPGFAKFLAYQIFVDLTYIPEFKFSENEFVVSGPGCDRGIEMLFEDRDGMTHAETLFWLRDNLQKLWKENDLRYYPEELFDHLPKHDRYYNVMMLENSFCEISKLVKAKRGTGRPRNGYRPTEQFSQMIEEW